MRHLKEMGNRDLKVKEIKYHPIRVSKKKNIGRKKWGGTDGPAEFCFLCDTVHLLFTRGLIYKPELCL